LDEDKEEGNRHEFEKSHYKEGSFKQNFELIKTNLEWILNTNHSGACPKLFFRRNTLEIHINNSRDVSIVIKE